MEEPSTSGQSKPSEEQGCAASPKPIDASSQNSSVMTSLSKEKPREDCRSDADNFTKPKPPVGYVVLENKPSTSSKSAATELNKNASEEKDYDSEPASLGKPDSKKKLKNRSYRGNQGKTMYPRSHAAAKEMRELTRKHAILEKNLKIEGLPNPPKFRKRRHSVSANIGRVHDKDTPHKRKRLCSVDTRPKKDHMPKWELMGGDANDPLNLNGLAHSEEGRLLNLKTPESSPLPTPEFRKIVYVKVPPNIEDPLNLEGKHDQKEIDRMLNTTIKKRHRSKKKKHDESQSASSSSAGASATATCALEESTGLAEGSTSQSESQAEANSETESVKTPEISTPTKPAAVRGSRSRSRSLSMSPERKFKRQLSGGRGRTGPNEPSKFPEKPMFTLGNYNRYYGYRNRDHEPDPRLQYFAPSWFKGKDVLDIGCNVGHITLALAEQFYPHKILGMDIDGKLIQAARQNIRHMLSLRRKDSAKYPQVFEMTRGPLEAHPLMGSSDQFPNNVLFLQGNYVPGSEEILKLQKEEYDTILALSITKWIHLNNGDNGLKLFFQKIYRQLRPGGRFILEPQPWSTYRKRAKLSPELFAKYQSIKLKPEGFRHYLLSIGFVKCEVIGVPVTKAKGFRRPLILFTKADNKQSSENSAYRDVCQECGSTDKSLCEHPQFAGMRRGPYASRLYDHMNYPAYSSTDSPYFSSRPNHGFNYNPYWHGHGMEDNSLGFHDMDIRGLGRMDVRGELKDNSVMMNYSNNNDGVWRNHADTSSSSAGSRPQSGNVSASVSESCTGSGSERSCSTSGTSGSGSTRSSSTSYYSPNGDIAGEPVYNVNGNGLNGDAADFGSSPEGPNGDIANDVVWDEDNGEGAAGGAAVDNEEIELEHVPVNDDGENNGVVVNGDSDLIQHWDNNNEDANIDAPVMGDHSGVDGGGENGL